MPLPTDYLISEHERLIAEGVGVSEACSQLRMSTATYYQWANAGEHSDTGTPCREFYERVVVPRRNMPRKPSTGPRGRYKPRKDKGHPRLTPAERSLSQQDLVGLLETLAQQGNVRAIQLLLERPWEKLSDAEAEPESEFDALDNVSPIRKSG
jgi:hypothetical protein